MKACGRAGPAQTGEGASLSCGPRPGTTLPHVAFRGHVTAFCLFTCSWASKGFYLYPLPSLSLSQT